MLRSLQRKLKSNIKLQILLGFIPCIIVLVYGFFYVIDLLSLYSSITLNNNIVNQHQDMGYIYECSESNGVVTYSTDINIPLELQYSRNIFAVYIKDKEHYELKDIVNSKSYYITEDPFIKDISSITNGFDITFDNGEVRSIPTNSLAYYIRIADIDKFEIKDSEHNIIETVSSIPHLTLIKQDEESAKFRYSLHSDYELALDQVMYCSILPSNSYYYDVEYFTVLRNIDDKYVDDFVSDSNIYKMLILCFVFSFIYIFCYYSTDLDVLGKYKRFYIISIVCSAILGIFVLFTYFILL